MTQDPVQVVQTVKAPIDTVWQALTQKEQMKQWYFDLAEFQPRVGFKFQFMGGTEENQYLHLCEITEAEPNRKLVHSWRYDGYEGNTLVTFELVPVTEHQTRVILTHAGLETFPESNPDFAKKNFEAGWKHIIGVSLPAYLENAPPALG
jgi:uncharacterized protein YndB with AHSA1/START domain